MNLEFPDDWPARSRRERERFFHKAAGFTKAEARKLIKEGLMGFQGEAPTPAHQERMRALLEAYGRFQQRRDTREYLANLPSEGLKPS